MEDLHPRGQRQKLELQETLSPRKINVLDDEFWTFCVHYDWPIGENKREFRRKDRVELAARSGWLPASFVFG